MNVTFKTVDKPTFKKLLLVAVLVPMIALYSLQSLSRIVGFFFLVLLILLLVYGFVPGIKRRWLIGVVFVSTCMTLFTNFDTGALFWTLWIFLVCFVLLSTELNFRWLRVIGANLIVFVTLFSVLEAAIRVMMPSAREQTNNIFIKLDDKDYYKFANLISEADRVDSPNDEYDFVHRDRIKSSGDLVTLGDFDGSYINIQDGRRVTVGSTGLRAKRVLVFGGSTIMCGEVPDSMTVTSNLQKLIIENDLEFDVLNYGISGLRIENQFNILKTIVDLNENDIVVFYDGVNDVNRIFEEGLKRRGNQTPWRQINRLARALEERSLLLRRVSITNYVDGLGVSQEYLDDQVASQISDNWLYYDGLARSYVNSKGARFVHILQPNWLTFKNGSEAVKLKKHWRDMKVIQTDFENFATPATQIEDFTKIFDVLGSPPFFDWAHVDEIGTAKVAEEMFAILKPKLTK